MSSSTLAELQQDFALWLMQASEQAAGRLGRPDGLAIYQNNYRVALVTSLEAAFPRAHKWLGETAFSAAAADYIDERPPHAWTLDAYGDRFAAALADRYPDDPEVGDLAAIDWAIGQAFISADAAPLDIDGLAKVDWDRAAIALVPSLMTLTTNSNADSLWLALADEAATPPPAVRDEPATVMVWRQGFEAVMRRADKVEAQVLDMARRGLTFAESCGELADRIGEGAAVEAAGTVLGRFVADGLVARMT
jgi:hypothetical protein